MDIVYLAAGAFGFGMVAYVVTSIVRAVRTKPEVGGKGQHRAAEPQEEPIQEHRQMVLQQTLGQPIDRFARENYPAGYVRSDYPSPRSPDSSQPKKEELDVCELAPVTSKYQVKGHGEPTLTREDPLDGKTVSAARDLMRCVWSQFPKECNAKVTRDKFSSYVQDNFVLQAGDHIQWEDIHVITDEEIVDAEPVIGEFKHGQWVHWITKAGNRSVRPSLVYKTEMRPPTGEKFVPEQWVLLKYPQSGKFMPFWTEASKCEETDSAEATDRDHIGRMYVDYVNFCDQERVAAAAQRPLEDEMREFVSNLPEVEKMDRVFPPPLAAFFRPENGKSIIRILPPMTKGQNIFEARRQHYQPEGGPAHQCNKSLHSGKWVGDCPICDHYNALWEQAHKHDKQGNWQASNKIKEEAKRIKPVERFYYNVIVRDEKIKGPMIYAAGKQVHKQIIEAIVGNHECDEPPLGDITDPIGGFDLVIYKEMQGPWPSYTVRPRHASSLLGSKNEMAWWLQNMWDLRAVCMSWHKTTEELAKYVATQCREDILDEAGSPPEEPISDDDFFAELAKM